MVKLRNCGASNESKSEPSARPSATCQDRHLAQQLRTALASLALAPWRQCAASTLRKLREHSTVHGRRFRCSLGGAYVGYILVAHRRAFVYSCPLVHVCRRTLRPEYGKLLCLRSAKAQASNLAGTECIVTRHLTLPSSGLPPAAAHVKRSMTKQSR